MDGEHSQPVVECIPTGALHANCYLVTCPTTQQTLVVDPGADADVILSQLGGRREHVVAIVHTHGHFDHISATEAVLEALPAPVPVLAHQADAFLYERAAREMGRAFGYAQPETLVTPATWITEGEDIRAGTVRLRVVQTPGHTPGSVSLVCDDGFVLSGDTLFRRGIGRTDLPGGDEDAIYESIETRLYTLPDAQVVYPGHGAATTIGEERASNPFVQARRSFETP